MSLNAPPLFPRFKPPTLEDRPFLEPRLQASAADITEGSFATLYLWRNAYNLRWCLWKDWALVVGRDADGDFGLMPFGPPARDAAARELVRFLKEEFSAPAARLEWCDDRFVAEMSRDEAVLFTPRRDDFDYVYASDSLIRLPGQDYQAKRNHIHRFRRAHPVQYAPLGLPELSACRDAAEEWYRRNPPAPGSPLAGEREALDEALRHFEALDLKGGIVSIHGRIEAFAIGSRLNSETAIIHFEKADPDIPGLYSVINQQFVENAWKEVPWINREDDAGLPGLRKSKQSYHPARLLQKFRGLS
jgi:hypothetical protein